VEVPSAKPTYKIVTSALKLRPYRISPPASPHPLVRLRSSDGSPMLPSSPALLLLTRMVGRGNESSEARNERLPVQRATSAARSRCPDLPRRRLGLVSIFEQTKPKAEERWITHLRLFRSPPASNSTHSQGTARTWSNSCETADGQILPSSPTQNFTFIPSYRRRSRPSRQSSLRPALHNNYAPEHRFLDRARVSDGVEHTHGEGGTDGVGAARGVGWEEGWLVLDEGGEG
jgi:hypothetical protein